MNDEPNEIDLKRFKRHERKVPWQLIRKILIAIVLIGLTIYITSTLKEKANSENEIELNFD